MQNALIGLAGGAVSGALAGFLVSLLRWWEKDLRDARSRAAGLPLPSDRVFVHYHWPFAALGASLATILVMAKGSSPLPAALTILAFPAACLVLLALSALFTLLPLLVRSDPRRNFDPETLIGMDMAEATKVLEKHRLRHEVEPDTPSDPGQHLVVHPAPRRSPYGTYVLLSVREGKVTWARFI
jgi:hypothetical protein